MEMKPPLAIEPSYVQDGQPIYHVVTESGMVEVRWHARLSREELKDLIRPFIPSASRESVVGALWI